MCAGAGILAGFTGARVGGGVVTVLAGGGIIMGAGSFQLSRPVREGTAASPRVSATTPTCCGLAAKLLYAPCVGTNVSAGLPWGIK